MIQEVLRRRFSRGKSSPEEGAWGTLPHLVLIDGGRGQLNAALEVMQKLGVDLIPCASIAKENEEIFLPHISDPIVLPPHSMALYLLQRIRDEAHRIACGYYHKMHTRKSFASALDGIPGIGPKRKRALLKKFGSVKAIREASADELAQAKGMTMSAAYKVKEYL
jgi:excinuclease ABC subunit C